MYVGPNLNAFRLEQGAEQRGRRVATPAAQQAGLSRQVGRDETLGDDHLSLPGERLSRCVPGARGGRHSALSKSESFQHHTEELCLVLVRGGGV